MEYFAEAARVASGYKYQCKDVQLVKTMTKVSDFICRDLLSSQEAPREWVAEENAAICGKLVLIFFDYLLHWEETNGKSFCPILESNHKAGISKAFNLLSHSVRRKVFSCEDTVSRMKSQRMKGPLGKALQLSKVSISDIHLSIVSEGPRKRRKR